MTRLYQVQGSGSYVEVLSRALDANRCFFDKCDDGEIGIVFVAMSTHPVFFGPVVVSCQFDGFSKRRE